METLVPPELLAEAKGFLKKCGFKQITFYPSQQQLAGYITHKETSHEVIIDFREGKVSLSTIEGLDVVAYEAAEWQTIAQAFEHIIKFAVRRGIIGQTPCP